MSDRGVSFLYAVLYVSKVSVLKHWKWGKWSRRGGASGSLLVRRLDSGELLLPLCETLCENGLIFCFLGLLMVDAPILQGTEVAATLEPNGSYEALDLGAIPKGRYARR